MNAPDSSRLLVNADQAENDIPSLMQAMGSRAKAASADMARASAAIKKEALLTLAGLLRQNLAALGAANQRDLERRRCRFGRPYAGPSQAQSQRH
jgi:glutamate-5-semialdehyde dehydrogenase